MAKIAPGSPYAHRSMVNGKSSAAGPEAFAEQCCWPGCGQDFADPYGGPPFCLNHLIKCAAWIGDHLEQAVAGGWGPRRPYRAPNFESRARVMSAQSQVYYVRIGDHVKIGVTGNLRLRLSQLRRDPEHLLAAEPGGYELERQRHLEFADERVSRREDFNPSPRLLAHIASVREQHGDPVMTTYPKYDLWHDEAS